MPTNKAPKAYAAVYERLDIESQTRPSRSSLNEQWRVGHSIKEILKIMDQNPELKQMVVRNLCTYLMLRFLVTGSISTFMIFHLPTQMYVLTHGWPLVLSWALTIGLLVLLRCTPYKVSSSLHSIKRKLISSLTDCFIN
jgi:hypothetical protein